jgi:phenylalanyl-tRNA synthetase beta chain
MVVLKFAHLDRLVGKKIERKKVIQILSQLEIKVLKQSETGLELEIPSFKVDVLREADVIEEILRIYGYNNVETGNTIRGTLAVVRKPDPEKIQNMVSGFLTDNGFFEIMNNSLTRSSYYQENSEYPAQQCVKILNPLSRELDVMRQTLLFGGLETISYNKNRQHPDARFYEFGNCYFEVSAGKVSNDNALGKFRENKRLALFASGRRYRESWNTGDLKYDFYDLKNTVNKILVKSGIDESFVEIRETSSEIFREGLSYNFKQDELVRFGVLKASLLKEFDCHQEVLYADFDWDLLLKKIRTKNSETEELPKFPEVRRDLALLLDRSVSFSEIEKLAYKTEKNILKKVGLFDVYEGEKIGEGKKSYALYFILQDRQKTLTDKDIDKTMNRLVKCFQDTLNAGLR